MVGLKDGVGLGVSDGEGGGVVVVDVGVGVGFFEGVLEGLGDGEEVAWAPCQVLKIQLTTGKPGCASSARAAAVNCAHIGAQ